MRKIYLVLLVAIPTVALAATFNQFSPATGILKGNASTYVTTAATSADIPPAGSTTQVQYNNGGVLGANSGFTYDGSGNTTITGVMNSSSASVGGTVTAQRVAVNNSTAPAIGMYSGGGSRLSFAVGSTLRGEFGTKGELTLTNGILQGGTKFTAAGTGCTIATTVGGATAGTFTLATGPCTSVAITMAGATGITATNGWTCQAHDRTSPTTLIGGESSSTTTTATFTIPAGAGTADVISFSCTGY